MTKTNKFKNKKWDILIFSFKIFLEILNLCNNHSSGSVIWGYGLDRAGSG
jgi:hypothetical protein